ncbi:hypothetical protein SBA4_4260019 [Candidatus Sulfopaludibacter sp. SbA4]|nr:hypothetical protein SBA4_4260019 [Candidatus Sulfopaludibacter sp. SbA4]
MEQLLLPPRRGVIPGEAEVQELRGFAEAGARRDRGPQPGVVRPDVPCGAASHAEAAHQDAVLVDGVAALDGVDGLEQVHLAGHLAGIAEAAIEVQHDGVAGGEFAGIADAVGQEVDLAESFVAAVEPGVQAPAVRRVGRVRGRHHEAVWLHALVDLGDVAAHDQAGSDVPRRLSLGKLGGALLTLLEKGLGLRDLVGVEEFVVLEGVADGLLEDEDVGRQRIAAHLVDGGAQVIEAGLEFGVVRGGQFDPGRRDRLGGLLRDGGSGRQENTEQRSHLENHYGTAARRSGGGARNHTGKNETTQARMPVLPSLRLCLSSTKIFC